MATRATVLAKIQAKFPQRSMANPTNSDLQAILTELINSLGMGDNEALTATSDGLTTGLATGSGFLVVTSANANNIVTLPALADVSDGHEVWGYVGANGCELRTPAASGETINGVDSDGTNEAAIPATTLFCCTATPDGWILRAWTELGAPITAIVPDAA